MNWKPVILALLFGLLMPFLMFLIGENWREPQEIPPETTPSTVQITDTEATDT